MSQTSRDRVNNRRVRTHEKNSGDTVCRLGRIIQSIFCAQSGASIRLTVWKWSGESRYPGAFLPVLENVCRAFSPGPTDCPWVSEDGFNLVKFFYSRYFWPTSWILLKQLFLSPSWPLSKLIAHSAAIDSDPIRAWGIIVKYFAQPTETAFQYLYMLYFILKSCSLLCSSLKLKTGSSCPLTTQAR